MTLEYARDIIARYGQLLEKSQSPFYFQPKSSLPCSIPLIKFAIFRYISELVRVKELNREIVESMIVAYTHLGFFVDDETAEKLNHLAKFKEPTTSGHIDLLERNKTYFQELNFKKKYLEEEINEFITECLRKRLREN